MSDRDYKQQLRDGVEALRDPLRLRIAICGIALCVAYFGIYGPLSGQIKSASRQQKEADERLALSQDVEFLRAQVAIVKPRIAPSPDANECVQYILQGIRDQPVKLVTLDTDSTVNVGHYEAVKLHVEVQGKVTDLDSFMQWLEVNDRLLRIDSIKMEPPRVKDRQPSLRLKLLALKVKQ